MLKPKQPRLKVFAAVHVTCVPAVFNMRHPQISEGFFFLLSALFLNSTLKQDVGLLPEEQFALGGCVNALVLLRDGFVVPVLSIRLRLMAGRGRAPPLTRARDPRS